MSESFFKGKRPWSKIKDQILGQYMPAYLAKVATLGKQIIIIDAFAGPGKFDDGSTGSPLIICSAAEKYVPDQYLAIFVNREEEHHNQLSSVLSRFIRQKKVIPIHGTAEELLRSVEGLLSDQTVFVYLDPFGLKGCEFSVIEPFLRRDRSYSTEILINFSVPTMHRLAACRAVAAGREDDPPIRALNDRLTRVLGGDYWKRIFWDDTKDPETKAEEVMGAYRENILNLETPRAFSGSCPVREKEGSAIKYYMTFYSRHRDAMILMNNMMCVAYHQRIHEAATEGTLFENTDWRETRDVRDLEGIILDMIREKGQKSRLDLWVDIIPRFFMLFTESEYRKVVAKLVEDEKISFKDVKGTGRLNNEAVLFLTENENDI